MAQDDLDDKGWTQHPRFGPLEEALQKKANYYAEQRSQGSKEEREWWRGMTDGLVRGKGMAGYHGQLSKREAREMKAILDDPGAREGVVLQLLQLEGWVQAPARGEEFLHGGWARHPRFQPLLEAMQKEIDEAARWARDFPDSYNEYQRGYIEGLVEAKGTAGYYSQLSQGEEAEMAGILADPASGEGLAGRLLRLEGWMAPGQEISGPVAVAEMHEAEGRLARGEVRNGETVRAEQAARLRASQGDASWPEIDG